MTSPGESAQAAILREFDHARYVGPEYAALREALNAMIVGAGPLKLDEIRALLDDMIATMPYGDVCRAEDCAARPLAFPVRVARSGSDRIVCDYRCHTCGDTWRCGWLVDAHREM